MADGAKSSRVVTMYRKTLLWQIKHKVERQRGEVCGNPLDARGAASVVVANFEKRVMPSSERVSAKTNE